MLEHSSAHHTSVAEGNKGPPFASIVTTRRRVQGSPLCFNCYDPPEGTRVPPLLQLLRSAATVKLLRSAGGYKGPPFASIVTIRRRVQGSPLCFNCYDPQLRLNCYDPQLRLNCYDPQLRLNCYDPQLRLNCYDPPEGTRVPPLLQLLRPAGGYKGPPFASIVTTRSRRRLRRDFRGRPPTFATTLSTVLGFHLSVPLAPLQRKGARVPGAISASKSCKRVKTCRWSPLGADRR